VEDYLLSKDRAFENIFDLSAINGLVYKDTLGYGLVPHIWLKGLPRFVVAYGLFEIN
jgi:hypothetical protein